MVRPHVELVRPGQERLHLGARVCEQLRVHAEPGGEGDPAVQLVSVLADLGDRRLPADHRHDSLVVVVEGLAELALHAREDVLRRPVARLLRHAAELRKRVVVSDGMFAKSPSAYTPGSPTVRSRLDVEAPTPTRAHSRLSGRAAMSPPPQTVRCVLSVVPSLKVT